MGCHARKSLDGYYGHYLSEDLHRWASRDAQYSVLWDLDEWLMEQGAPTEFLLLLIQYRQALMESLR